MRRGGSRRISPSCRSFRGSRNRIQQSRRKPAALPFTCGYRTGSRQHGLQGTSNKRSPQKHLSLALVPRLLRANTSDAGNDGDGSRGDKRSNAGDDSSRSDGGNDDDDSHTKLRLELRCWLRLCRQRLTSQQFSLRFALLFLLGLRGNNAEPRLAVA